MEAVVKRRFYCYSHTVRLPDQDRIAMEKIACYRQRSQEEGVHYVMGGGYMRKHRGQRGMGG